MKPLPHDLDTEKALLSSLLINPERRIKPPIKASDFYLEKHQKLFTALQELESPDMTLLKGVLEKKGTLQTVGGIDYVAQLFEVSLTSGGVPFYAERLRELSRRRTLAMTGETLFQEACDLTKDLGETISNVKGAIRDLDRGMEPGQEASQGVLDRVFKDIERRSQDGNYTVGILSGYDCIDRNLHGFEPKTLIYVGGRPSMGKTALALNLAENFARLDQGAVVFFSLEMSSEAITRRRLAAESGVFLSRIRSGDIERDQWTRLIEAMDRLEKRSLLIFDHPRYKTIEALVSKADDLAMDNKIAALFVDHIQLMRCRQKFASRHLEVSFISGELKSLAKNLNIPVIALTQLNRGVEHRQNQRPRLADMKESGDLEQDADVVIGLYRESKESERLELAGLKGRDIGTWSGALRFNRFTQKIEDYEEETF